LGSLPIARSTFGCLSCPCVLSHTQSCSADDSVRERFFARASFDHNPHLVAKLARNPAAVNTCRPACIVEPVGISAQPQFEWNLGHIGHSTPWLSQMR
jgi:hypothetical protein